MDALYVNDGAPSFTARCIKNRFSEGVCIGSRNIKDLGLQCGVEVILCFDHRLLELLVEFCRRVLFSEALGVLKLSNKTLQFS